MSQLENKSQKLDTEISMLKEDLKQVDTHSNSLHRVLKEVDNNHSKNNLTLKGLKEGIERDDLKSYLDALLTSCMGSETNVEVNLTFAHWLGSNDRSIRNNKSRDVLLGFADQVTKFTVLDSLWEQSKVVVEGQQLTFF